VKLAAVFAALSLAGAGSAFAQAPASPGITLGSNATLLNVTAEGRAQRRPDLATFNAGVVTQARTAAEALTANSTRMDAVVAALKRSGVAERDIQTSSLSLQPQYYYPQRERPAREPSGAVVEPAEPQAPRIIGYEARNSVTVRVRRISDMGRIIDTLVGAGVNQVDGPYFTVENQEAAADEARAEAIKNARTRAELYARAAGLRVARILTISEGGGYYPVARQDIVAVTAIGSAMAPPPPPPPPTAVQAGEVTLGVSVSVQFALER
jgi:uncharacterized protein YggE